MHFKRRLNQESGIRNQELKKRISKFWFFKTMIHDSKFMIRSRLLINRYISIITSYQLPVTSQITPQAGFTLVELLVTISLIGFVFFISINAFRSFDQTNALRISENKLADALHTAQSLALSGRSIENNTLTPSAFGVHLEGATAFVFGDACHTANEAGLGVWDPDPARVCNKKIGGDISLTNGVTWIAITPSLATPVDIAFKRTTAQSRILIPSGESANPQLTVQFKNIKNNTIKTLTFDKNSGRVDVEY